eukprot:3553302-Alexandrium_andersonii.AAC.1
MDSGVPTRWHIIAPQSEDMAHAACATFPMDPPDWCCASGISIGLAQVWACDQAAECEQQRHTNARECQLYLYALLAHVR